MLSSLLRQVIGSLGASLITSGVLTGEQSQAITGGGLALFTVIMQWIKNQKLNEKLNEKIKVDNKSRYN